MKTKLSLILLLASSIFSINSFAGKSVYSLKFDDPRGVFFTEESYGVKADGRTDVSDTLQKVLNEIKSERGFGTLYLPEGKYLLTKTVYVPDAIRIVGYGRTRPVFVLGKNTPGFDNEPKPMLWFTGGIVRDESKVTEGNAGTFYSGISNVDFRIEKGNPMAVGLRTHVAQHGVFDHITIHGGDGYACLSEVGNEMEDVEFFGARYGIESSVTAPSWPMAMVDLYFEGQKEAAILSRNAGMAIVNMKIKNTPAGVICAEELSDRLFIEDSYFENVKTAIVITAEEGANNETNLVNVYCRNVPVLADFRKKGNVYKVSDKSYKVTEFVSGLISGEMGDNSEYGTISKIEPAQFPETFTNTVPPIPDMSSWVSITSYGAVGDGETDDTEAIQKAISENDVVFVPEGWYRISNTIKLHNGSRVIGLHPFATQFVLSESTPAFSGFGAPVPMVESSEGGDDIISGIGICTGGYNSRAVGLKWMAGEKSLVNDVKFVGGHGTMMRPVKNGNGPLFGGFAYMFGPMKISSPTEPVAVWGPDQAWDNQYWSLWITNGGGGTFKNIWTANTYASSGLYVSDTKTPSRMYAISLEHHVRFESRWKDVENFKVYAMQYEEESREGRDAVSMTMDNCRNILFANLWFYRVVRVMTPRDYGTLVSNCENIEFRNVKAWTQIMSETAATAYDMNKNISIYPLAFAYGRIAGSEANLRPAGALFEPVRIGKGYQFATGATTDSRGNVYFCEGALKKIYKWDAVTGAVTLVGDYPYRPLALAVDTQDNLLVVCRYPGQPGFKGESITFVQDYKDANSNYSGWGSGRWGVTAYAINTGTTSDTMIPLSLVPTSSVKAEKVIYPSHSLRTLDFEKIYDRNIPEESFIAPDKVTIIPHLFDICRAIEFTSVKPGQKEPLFIAWEDPKTTYKFSVNSDGSLSLAGRPTIRRGEYGMAYDSAGNLYVAEGQIFVFDAEGREIRRINLEERPLSIEVGGADGEYLFATTNSSLYRIRIK